MGAMQRILVSGRVQQVGYRDYMVRKAQALGVRGWVRNLTDGRVEMLADGDDAAIKAEDARQRIAEHRRVHQTVWTGERSGRVEDLGLGGVRPDNESELRTLRSDSSSAARLRRLEPGVVRLPARQMST